MAINNKDGDTAGGRQPTLEEQVEQLRQQAEVLKRRIDALEREAEEKDTARHGQPNLRTETPKSADEGKSPGPAEDGEPEENTSLGRRIAIAASHAAYYLALVMLIIGAVLIRSAQSGAPVSIAGYCGLVVLSGSMQDVIPQDSFVITHQVDANSLQVGDDITFMASADTCVTHRIIEINRQPDGTLSFRTKGTNNQSPDSNPVAAANVVGKVIYHNLWLGQIAQWIRKNWPLVIFLVAVWAVLSWYLTRSLKDDESEETDEEEPEESTSAKGATHPAEKHKWNIKIRKKGKENDVSSDEEEAQPKGDGSHCSSDGTGAHAFRHPGVAGHQPEEPVSDDN